ncbi:hypothetical protein TIFTF001_000869 [Ficus carica]|uniref:FRIGIDA-like protein n=1 Tax=Ficus carica TaxID=3494 RepID=A0AA87Z4L0_FICCA|nr:hypothetical protein TIFTF001_000869 [Ficus carica]
MHFGILLKGFLFLFQMDNLASDSMLLKQKQEWFSKECKELQSLVSEEWTDLVNHTNTVRSSLQTQFEKLQEREIEIVAKEKQLEAKEMKLKMRIESEASQLDQIEKLGKELLREAEVNRQEAALLQSVIERSATSLRLDRSEYRAVLKESKDALELTERQLIVKQISFEKCGKELELKEEQLKVCKTCIAESEKEIKLKEEKLKSIQNSIFECSNELELRKKQLDLLQKLKEENLDSLKRLADQCAHKVDMKEKEFESLVKELELKEKLLESKFKGFDLIKCSRALGEKEREFEGRVKDIELRVKEFDLKLKANTPNNLLQIDQPKQTHTSFASLQSCTSKREEDILGVLNQQLKRHNSVCGLTFAILEASFDPAKALLMKASPEISPPVKEEAMKLARAWRTKLTVTCKNGLEVFGLLQSKTRRNASPVPHGQSEQCKIKLPRIDPSAGENSTTPVRRVSKPTITDHFRLVTPNDLQTTISQCV